MNERPFARIDGRGFTRLTKEVHKFDAPYRFVTDRLQAAPAVAATMQIRDDYKIRNERESRHLPEGLQQRARGDHAHAVVPARSLRTVHKCRTMERMRRSFMPIETLPLLATCLFLASCSGQDPARGSTKGEATDPPTTLRTAAVQADACSLSRSA